jgi:hypothetical protein
MNDTAAVAAFEKMERTGKAFLDHPKTCWLCRSHFLSRFLPCLTWKYLMSRFIDAHAEFAQYRAEFKVAEDMAVAPTAEWLENLYKLQ